jgi:hypothetical protein
MRAHSSHIIYPTKNKRSNLDSSNETLVFSASPFSTPNISVLYASFLLLSVACWFRFDDEQNQLYKDIYLQTDYSKHINAVGDKHFARILCEAQNYNKPLQPQFFNYFVLNYLKIYSKYSYMQDTA